MTHKLVIVESPAKARTIEKILGKGYTVIASLGHIRDLPQYRFGVNVKNDFSPSYEVPKEKKEILKKLVKAAKGAEAIYLATDPDREGEAISWHLLEASKIKDIPVKRIVFHEITKTAIKEAFQSPREIDMDLVDAQQARRVLDRVVGYRLSPLLWSKVEKGLSAGRVQSVAVRMVSDRESEINSFTPKEYWTIDATLAKEEAKQKNITVVKRITVFNALLSNIKGSRRKISVPNEEKSTEIANDLKTATYTVDKIEKKQVKRQPYAPFTTSTLQQESWTKLHFTAKRTMLIAQQLYEGISIGAEGQLGLITYMRTDSTTVSPEARNEARTYIRELFGPSYTPDSPRVFKKKSKGAQEAHEAVRPTSAYRDIGKIKDYLNQDQRKLYELIWKRMIASEMADAIIDSTSVLIEAKTSDPKQSYLFRASGSLISFPGFLSLHEENPDEETGNKENSLPILSEGENLNCKDLNQKQHFTQPPARYTEASLIRALEENGIGRPSTYAPTLSTIQDRKYVQKEKGKFIPTNLGLTVNTLLVEHFPKIVDLGFTAEMEQELDEISRGEREWIPVIRDFYDPFQQALDQAKEAIPDEASGLICEECNKAMVVRSGRRGRFIGCSGYPACKNTKPLPGDEETEPPEVIEESCEKCERPMVLRIGRNGKFLACSGYPDCKNTKSYIVKTGVLCPDCKGDIVEKRSKKGRIFYGCTGYPNCTFTLRQPPYSKPCPECGGLLVTSGQESVRCIGCKFKEEILVLESAGTE